MKEFDLRARRGALGLSALLNSLRTDQRREQRDDGHHHQHFDQRDAAFGLLVFGHMLIFTPPRR